MLIWVRGYIYIYCGAWAPCRALHHATHGADAAPCGARKPCTHRWTPKGANHRRGRRLGPPPTPKNACIFFNLG